MKIQSTVRSKRAQTLECLDGFVQQGRLTRTAVDYFAKSGCATISEAGKKAERDLQKIRRDKVNAYDHADHLRQVAPLYLGGVLATAAGGILLVDTSPALTFGMLGLSCAGLVTHLVRIGLADRAADSIADSMVDVEVANSAMRLISITTGDTCAV